MPPTRTTVVSWDLGELIELIDAGIAHCRAGNWKKGAECLGYVAERSHGDLSQASLYLSYLGCAIARTQKRTKEARALCRHAVKVEFYQPENWANLAEVMMLSNWRKEAVAALKQGLEIDPQNRRLQKLSQELGMRRPPVLPFLARGNPLNHFLGRLRNDIFGSIQLERPD